MKYLKTFESFIPGHSTLLVRDVDIYSQSNKKPIGKKYFNQDTSVQPVNLDWMTKPNNFLQDLKAGKVSNFTFDNIKKKSNEKN